MPDDGFAMVIPGASADSRPCSSKIAILGTVRLLTTWSKCLHTWAFLHQRYGAATPSALGSGLVFKPDVVAATALLKAAAADAATQLEKTPEFAEDAGVPPAFFDNLRGWFDRHEQVRQLWGQGLVAAAAGWLTTASSEVQCVTPVYGHFLNDKVVNVRLVKTNLLGPVRKTLSEKVMALHKAMSLYTATSRDAPMGGQVSAASASAASASDPADVLAEAALIFDGGKTALTVVAACVIVYEGGPRRKEEAATLVAVPRPEIPKTLWAELVKASKGGGVKDQAASASGPSST